MRCGDVTPVFQRHPDLELVHLIGCAELTALNHDHLQALPLLAEPLSATTVAAVMGGSGKRLQRLALGFCYELLASTEAQEAFLDSFDGGDFPALRELYLAFPPDPAARRLAAPCHAGCVLPVNLRERQR